jgi:hypothetical protein
MSLNPDRANTVELSLPATWMGGPASRWDMDERGRGGGGGGGAVEWMAVVVARWCWHRWVPSIGEVAEVRPIGPSVPEIWLHNILVGSDSATYNSHNLRKNGEDSKSQEAA